MRCAALTSGGKDSILAIQKTLDAGHTITHLVTVTSQNPDSYMFHTSNIAAVPVIARLAGMAYHEIASQGVEGEEVGDLEVGLSVIDCDAIVCGAIASRYQKSRVDGIAERLSLEVLAPLWQMDPFLLLDEVAARLTAIIVVTAADGIPDHLLGAPIDQETIRDLTRLSVTHGVHPAGEGGEYETLTLAAPFYESPLSFTHTEVLEGGGRRELVLSGFA
ncbi:MAG: diphthine--ammonia ligase [Methanomicrobiales archaeon]|nr:diphthine--ammonia ligase [Methanomicrobiales archaeon]